MRVSLSVFRAGAWIGLGFLAFLAVGCGHDPFAAPSRPTPTRTNATIESAKTIFMIIPGKPEDEVQLWAIWADREASDQHLVFRAMGPPPAEPTTTESEVVRKAPGDGASALIVVPDDSKDLPQTLADAEAKGVPVILLGRTIPAPPGSPPFASVTPAPIEEWAGRIVSTTLADAKKAGRPGDGTALIVTDKHPDSSSAERVALLRAAAEKAGLKPAETVTYDGEVTNAAKLAVIEAAQAHPDLAVVLTADGEGMHGASQARVELKGKPTFFVGGFVGYRAESSLLNFSSESCYVDGKVEQVGRQAALNIIARLRSEPIDEHATVKLELSRGLSQDAGPTKADPAKVESKATEVPPTLPFNGAKP